MIPRLPIRKITKYRKLVVVVLVIVFMYSSMVTYTYNDTRISVKEKALPAAVNESELLRKKEERTLAHNVIPNLHTLLDVNVMYMYANNAKEECTFPSNKSSEDIDYTANITKTDFRTAEKTVFKNLAESVRELTRQANNRLQEILKEDQVVATKDLYNRKKKEDIEPTVRNALAVDFGSHLYFPGGHWIPLRCKAKWKVAVIIPYRNRTQNLHVFLKNLVPFLLNQELEFGIFLAEQGFSEIMNRGLMKNIGYQMARLSGTEWDCYVFHDVDYVPMNSTNYYGCDDYPKHYATRLEEYKYGNPFMEDFGGVVGLTGLQIDMVNGYSNMYWGWGGEDSDLYQRVVSKKLHVNASIEGYYLDLPHKKKTRKEKCVQRFCLLEDAVPRMKTDGINEIRYENSANISLSTLYTKISVDVVKTDWNHNYRKCRVFKRNKKEDRWVAVVGVMCYAGVIIVIFSCAVCGLAVRDYDAWSRDAESDQQRRKTKKNWKYFTENPVALK